MNIRIIMLGKNKHPGLTSWMEDYGKMISPWHHIEFLFLKEELLTRNIELALKKEGQRVQEHIHDDDYVIVLDERGKSFSSHNFADYWTKLETQNIRRMVFIMGSSHGLSPEVKSKAHVLLSLSPLTMSHQVVRIVLLEQLYRIFSIQRGMKYHK